MFSGCLEGNIDTIRLAVDYGASESIILLGRVLRYFWNKALPKSNDVPTFKFLLELGTRVDDPDVHLKQLKVLMECLCKRHNWALLSLFLHAGLGSQVMQRSKKELPIALISLIKQEAPLRLVGLLIDHGADLNYVQSGTKSSTVTPLSTSIMVDSKTNFEYLLGRGANIHGQDLSHPSKVATHIPIFAAARVAIERGPKWINLRLVKRADINHCTPILEKRRWGPLWGSWVHLGNWEDPSPLEYYNRTPLFVYLDSINTWEPNQIPSPVKALNYLSSKGALLRHLEVPGAVQGGFKRLERSETEMLLRKWGASSLASPEFFTCNQWLLEHGAGGPRMGTLYRRGIPSLPVARSDGWARFLRLYLGGPDSDPRERSARNRLLGSEIECRERKFVQDIWQNGSVPESTTLTIDCLIASGANINSDSNLEIFIRLCEKHCSEAFSRTYNERFQERRFSFIGFLVTKGADPMMKGGPAQKSALQMLEELKNSKRSRRHKNEGPVEVVFDFATMLAKERIVYLERNQPIGVAA
ncbi:Uu.00g030940.m01.CDS01 [Anthostomella pinea]|uniref:Uu.00g030940.m01.CDS01 n=1 Tax=Anthostomella pinea TaxID=933095 RepID=A0AAI8V8E4_9PEZI|nr:Uu.00g030940.m01.CDS01 [Anthostomella pinea]